MFDQFHVAVVLLGILLTALVYRRFQSIKSNPRRLPLPPGPKPDPIIGNARHFPVNTPWITFTEWKKTYGDMIYMNALGTGMVIINSYEVSCDLMEKRAIYADRPSMPFLGEMVGLNRTALVAGYNDLWRRHRTIMHAPMQRPAIETYWIEQQNVARSFLGTLLDKPKDFYSNLKLMSGKLIISITYGIQVESSEDPYIINAESTRAMVKYLSPTSALVNVFPIMRYIPSWFPGAKFKREAARLREVADNMVGRPFERVKADLAAGVAVPSLTTQLLESPIADEEDIKWATGTLYGAGADGIASILALFVLAMTLHPKVQKKAQEEIDRVIGKNRLPTFEDRDSLPYLECILKEIYRWYPISPLGTPRRVTEDDYYNGYWIPAGSTVYGNNWAMSRDERMYKDGDRFSPERFEGIGAEKILDPRTFIFGFGRRSCPGVHFVDATLYISMAYILAGFNISKAKDANGNEITPEIIHTSEMITRVNDFPCSIQPRSPQVVDLIRD